MPEINILYKTNHFLFGKKCCGEATKKTNHKHRRPRPTETKKLEIMISKYHNKVNEVKDIHDDYDDYNPQPFDWSSIRHALVNNLLYIYISL